MPLRGPAILGGSIVRIRSSHLAASDKYPMILRMCLPKVPAVLRRHGARLRATRAAAHFGLQCMRQLVRRADAFGVGVAARGAHRAPEALGIHRREGAAVMVDEAGVGHVGVEFEGAVRAA
eukprot:2550603-Pleurochrysis_carterae.AAC.6